MDKWAPLWFRHVTEALKSPPLAGCEILSIPLNESDFLLHVGQFITEADI